MIATLKTFAKQREALRLLRDDHTNEIMYGGGARGGKSWIGNAWVLMCCLSMPGSAFLVAREELTKLRDTTLNTFFKVTNALGVKEEYTFNAQSNTASFHNGSIIFFREIKYVPSDPEFDRLGSYDLTGAFIDEAQQIHPKAISVLRGRFSLLSGVGWRTIPKMLLTCNPAKNWIYTDFYKPSKDGILPSDKAFVVSLATDNPFVTEDYINFLKKSDPITVARLLDGNFEYDDDPTALLSYDDINNLLHNTDAQPGLPAVIVDAARFGKDKAVIWKWNGWRVRLARVLLKSSVPQLATAVREVMVEIKCPANRVVIDEDGVGGGVRDLIPGSIGFIANSRALTDPKGERDKLTGKHLPENYNNLKSQCKYRMAARIRARQVFLDEHPGPDAWEMLGEELAQWKRWKVDTDGKLAAAPKEVEKEKLGRSPDYADPWYMRELLELLPKPGGGLAVPRHITPGGIF